MGGGGSSKPPRSQYAGMVDQWGTPFKPGFDAADIAPDARAGPLTKADIRYPIYKSGLIGSGIVPTPSAVAPTSNTLTPNDANGNGAIASDNYQRKKGSRTRTPSSRSTVFGA